ncbi:MAG TPA: hypothetical protein VJM15_08020 [Sphingomicrobium sp.]|nr:hypothetical protein [Sphingomicrobium sp.]
MAQHDSLPVASRDHDFEVYAWLREYEEHFNQTQVEIKKLASAWMLAGLAAIAFIVRGDLKAGSSMFDTAVLLGIIGSGANIGLFSLWILDQLCSQKLLGAAFEVGLHLERRNSNLPPIRSLMWVKSNYRGMGRFHALFYACPMLFNALAAGYATRLSPAPGHLVAAAIATIPLIVVLGQWARALRYRPMDLKDKTTHPESEVSKTVERWKERLESRFRDHS